MSIQFLFQNEDNELEDFTDRVNLADRNVSLTTNAEEMTVGGSTMVVEDPLGDWNINGHRIVHAIETDAFYPDFPSFYTGYATIREIDRGPYRTGAARQWAMTLDDLNTTLARRLFLQGTTRPAETDVERMAYLFASAPGLSLGDDTYFSTDNPVDMDAADISGMSVYDVVNDCILQSGKSAFFLEVPSGGIFIGGTFYDLPTSAAFSSELRISNFDSDIDAEVGEDDPGPGGAWTWAASQDTKMRRDPTRVYSGVRGQYDGGSVMRYRPATAVQFATGGRDTSASWPFIKTAAKANARADRYLLSISTEEDVITTRIFVHPTHVNDARAGHRIQARFSHLPGYEEYTWMRILNRTVTFITPLVYEILYTLSPGDIATPAGTCTTAIVTSEDYASGAISLGCQDWTAGPLSAVVSLAPSAPSLIIAMIAGSQCSFTPGPFISTDSPYTMFGPGTSNQGVAAYQANTTTGGTIAANFTGGDAAYQAVLAASIATSATTPVQSAAAMAASSVTLGATPTVGNIIITATLQERDAVVPLTGWTTLAQDASLVAVDSLHGSGLMIQARCVVEGDTAVIPVPSAGPTHWSWVSEWAIT